MVCSAQQPDSRSDRSKLMARHLQKRRSGVEFSLWVCWRVPSFAFLPSQSLSNEKLQIIYLTGYSLVNHKCTFGDKLLMTTNVFMVVGHSDQPVSLRLASQTVPKALRHNPFIPCSGILLLNLRPFRVAINGDEGLNESSRRLRVSPLGCVTRSLLLLFVSTWLGGQTRRHLFNR